MSYGSTPYSSIPYSSLESSSATIAVDVLTLTASVQAPTVTGGATIAAGTPTGTVSQPDPTATGTATTAADALTAMLSQPAAAATGSATATADCGALTLTQPDATATGEVAGGAAPLPAWRQFVVNGLAKPQPCRMQLRCSRAQAAGSADAAPQHATIAVRTKSPRLTTDGRCDPRSVRAAVFLRRPWASVSATASPPHVRSHAGWRARQLSRIADEDRQLLDETSELALLGIL